MMCIYNGVFNDVHLDQWCTILAAAICEVLRIGVAVPRCPRLRGSCWRRSRSRRVTPGPAGDRVVERSHLGVEDDVSVHTLSPRGQKLRTKITLCEDGRTSTRRPQRPHRITVNGRMDPEHLLGTAARAFRTRGWILLGAATLPVQDVYRTTCPQSF